MDPKAAIPAGLIAGVVFMMMEMILVAAMGESPWGPPRIMAAIVMGRDSPAAAGELRLRPVHGRDDRALRAVRGPGFSPRLGDFPLAPQLRWCPRSRRYLRAARLSRKHLSINRDPASLVRDGEELDRIGSHIVFVLVLAWAYLAIARRAPNTMNPGR